MLSCYCAVVGPADCLAWSLDASQWCRSVMGALLLLYTMHHGPYTIRTTDAPKVTERNCVWHTRRPLHQCTALLHNTPALHHSPGTLAEKKQVTAQFTSSPDICPMSWAALGFQGVRLYYGGFIMGALSWGISVWLRN